ncbi:MAG TPA: phosphoribosylformylglycinamidine synthase subunit PurQ [bacterium]|nr:phosphoribosylformylglycinamidine synthase subunit PurQ [bacterium]
MNTLILSGFGTNCERETAYACEQGGAAPGSVHVRHISEIYAGTLRLEDYGFLMLIGGFLDGDDLGGARACANRFRYRRMPKGGTFLERLHGFVEDGRPVLGICNGFQLLVKLGLLPALEDEADGEAGVTLTTNARGRFEDRWVHLRAEPASPSIFTRGVEALELPVRHGEGRVLGASDAVLEQLVERKLAPLRYALPDGTPTEAYPENPNGSPHGIASLCSPSGTVMGLMPHPEAFNHYTNHPQWTRRPHTGEDGDGLVIFRNAYAYLRG